jgi:signal transduction histidine kinase
MKPLNLLNGVVSRLNLWTRLTLVLTAGFITLFGVFSFVSLRVLDDSTQRILTERQVIAETAAERYDEFLTEAYDELEKATTFAAFDPSAQNLTNERRVLAETYSRLGIFSLGVIFLDMHGRTVLAEPAYLGSSSMYYVTSPFIAQVVQTGQGKISNPFHDRASGKPAVAVTIPIFDREKHLMSMLSGWTDLTSPVMTIPVEQARKLGETGHAELVDDNAIVVASTESHGQPLELGDHSKFYLRMLATRSTGVENVPEENGPHAGEMHVMAFAPLSVVHWGIAVGGTEAETFAPVRQLQNYIFIFGTLSFIGIFFATLWGARLLVRPVKVLTRAAKHIADGDLSEPIRLTEGGEIGTLADSFEAMRVRLQRSLGEITAWSNELETRVRARTLELEMLNAELQDRERERRQLLERVINAQEEERKRIARELHDEIAQAVTALLMSLEGIEIPGAEISLMLQDRISRAKRLSENALHELRAMIHDLRPAALDDLGLFPAIRWHAEQHLTPLGIQVSIDTRALKSRLPPSVETVVFRVMQEAISNISRHANARNVRILLESNGTAMIARIEDDGLGFEPSRPRGGEGWGLVGMRERVNLIGGKVEVSTAPGSGTKIVITIPVESGNNGKG